MPYGEIFVGTFKTIWRHKKLWLFGLLGLSLIALGNGMYMGIVLNWERHWFGLLGDTLQRPGGPGPDQMLSGVVWIFVGMGVMALASLLGYLINLVMRGATINEAAVAWQGERSETERGLRAGVARALHIFVIDLLWWLPGLIFIGGGYVLGIIVYTGAMGTIPNNISDKNMIAVMLLSTLGLIACIFALILVFGLLYGILGPLMYQSAVQGQRDLGTAIKEGWRLARAHLGPMFIFWLLTLALWLGLRLLVSLVTLPLVLPWMGSWLRSWLTFMEQVRRGAQPTMPPLGAVPWGWVFLSVLGSTIVTWLYMSFLQTFTLTMYAEVYRRLTGAPAPALVAGSPIAPGPSGGQPIVKVTEEPVMPGEELVVPTDESGTDIDEIAPYV